MAWLPIFTLIIHLIVIIFTEEMGFGTMEIVVTQRQDV